MDLPSFVQIEPVGQCNLRCQMCPIQFREDGPPWGPPAFMPFATFTRLIDQFPGVKELHLQGLGEPFLHPQIFEMIAHAASKGIRVTTNSNLTLLRPSAAERCVRSGLDTLHVSIDGATASTYEGIRKGARFHQVIRNLTALLETRGRLESRTPKIKLVTVLMRRTLDELPDLVRLAHTWGVDELFVQHLCHDFGEASLPQRYQPMREFVQAETLLGEDPSRVEACFQQVRELAGRLGLTVRLPRVRGKVHPPGTPGRQRCGWPWRGAYLSYQGYAMPCCMVSTPDRIHFGNMVEQGAAAVWAGQAYETFRRQLDSDAPPEICRSCAIYQGIF